MLLGKYINKYYLKYALYFIIGVVALVLVDYYQLKIPELLGKIVDTSSMSINEELIASVVIELIIVAVVLCIGRIVWRLALLTTSKKIETSLRRTMFEKSERLSQKYYHENKVGTVMAWYTNDLETVEEYLGWGSIMLVDAIFMSILVIIKMVNLDIALSIITAIPVVLIIIWGGLVEKFMAMKWDKRQQAFDDLYDFTQENFTGIRVIKAFVKENQEIKAFAKIAKKNKDVNVDFVKTSVLFDVLIEVICGTVFAFLLGVGGYFVYSFSIGNGAPIDLFGLKIDLTPGKLVTFIGYFEKLIWPLIAMGQIISMRSRATSSLKRITEFLDSEEDVKNPENPIILENVKGKITFKNFSFIYPDSNTTSLEGVSFEIMPGEIVGIVGKIGSGKTTLVNSLLRLYNVNEGTIFIDDCDIMKCDIASVRNAISYVPQDNFLFSDKVRNNIAFSNLSLEYEKIEMAARFAAVHENIIEFEQGYDTISGERGVTLSGGQKQRVSIARAYVKEAPIMIMDDSVSAVDVKTEETILHNIKEKRSGMTTLVIASRVSTVMHMDKILVLNDGTLEAFGTHQELLEKSPVYQRMVFLQELEKEVEGGGSNE